MRPQTLADDERPYAALVHRLWCPHPLDYYSLTDPKGMEG